MKRTAILFILATTASPAIAQDASDEAPRRTRVIIGPSLAPAYPGADRTQFQPYIDVSRVRGDAPFTYEAPDESSGLSLYNKDGLSFGPVVNFQSSRRRRDTGGLDRVGFTVEVGGAVQYQTRGLLRALLEVRKGIGGHRGVVGMTGVDYVARDGDRWLWAVGPRLTIGDVRFSRAYFGVSQRETLATDIPTYNPGSTVMVGGTATALRQLTPRWSLFGFGKYDRLVGDAANSPVVSRFGSRDQWSGGLGLGYTFGRGVN